MKARPLSSDPAAPRVAELLENANDWLLASPGDFTTAGAEVWKADGTGRRAVVLMQVPCRLNHDDHESFVRLALSVEDAAGLAHSLAVTSAWLTKAGLA